MWKKYIFFLHNFILLQDFFVTTTVVLADFNNSNHPKHGTIISLAKGQHTNNQ